MTAALRADRAASSPVMEALFDGQPILVVGPETGCLLLAAATATTAGVAWAVRHSTGLLRAVVEPERADALCLPPMSGTDRTRRGNLQAVAVDGADPATTPDDLVASGHVLVELVGTEPWPTAAGAVAEAAVRLCARAGMPPGRRARRRARPGGGAARAGRTARSRRRGVGPAAHRPVLRARPEGNPA